MSTQNSTTFTPFLMFTGKAEEAMDFYVSLFPTAKVDNVSLYGHGEPGAEGSVKVATFSLNGQKVMCSDSPVEHDFTFTPSISLFVSCTTDEELDRYVEPLSKDGKVLMPPDNYGFSTKFAWLEDRFGVSWQLNLP